MSNLTTAKQALAAELAHAREGLAYYQSRVTALELALGQVSDLNNVEAATGATATTGKAARGKAKTKPGAAKSLETKAAPATTETEDSVASSDKLPKMGVEFWTSLITEKGQTAPEILQAAIRSLGIQPSRDLRKKIQGRMTQSLMAMVKTNAVSDSGQGRERRYFKAAS